MTRKRPAVLLLTILLAALGCRPHRVAFSGMNGPNDRSDPVCDARNPCDDVDVGAPLEVLQRCDRNSCHDVDARALEVLQPRCFVEQPGRPPVPIDCQSDEALVHSTAAVIRVRARCQEERTEDLIGGRRSWPRDRRISFPRPLDQRRYVVGGASLLRPDEANPFDTSELEELEVLPNTRVEVLRRWPDASGDCSLAMVRVIDAGGHRTEGQWGYARLDDLAREPDESLPTPEEVIAEAERRRREEIQARLRAIADQEVAQGECDRRSHRVLEQVLHRANRIFEGMRDRIVRHVGHDYVVATDEGVQLRFNATLSGTYHLFAVALGEVQLSGQDEDGHELSMPSEYERTVTVAAGAPHVDSLRVIASDFDRSALTVRGHGCTLVMGFDFVE